ncbi:MAG: phosphoribosyltransferase [Pseudonocardiaceae bacterium]
MPRVFDSTGVLRLDEDTVHAGMEVLAEALAAAPPDVVIGVARGGTRLAHALAAHLRRPQVVVRASHNHGEAIRQQATGIVDLALTTATDLDHGLRVLLCDDIYGTGATLAAVSAALDALIVPRQIQTVTLCRNEGATDHPDLWLWDVRDWVVFPWEPPAAATPTGTLPPRHHPRRRP